MSWVQERVEEIKRAEESQVSQREWQLHCERVIRAKAPDLARSVWSAIERDIQQFNESFPNIPHRKIEFHKQPSNRVLVRKPHYPALILEAWLDLEGRAIRFTCSMTADSESSPQHTVGVFRIRLFDDGNLMLFNGERPLTCEEASQLLLDPILRP
jgi:seryl-tRNA synthetase